MQAARAADVALLYVALPSFKESEGYDRADLDLTPQQVALIKAVSAAQPQTVVILNNGSAVAMSDWIEGVAAVLEAWMMGQAGGGAIADVLFGKVNPSGKLAETFPIKVADTPAHINFPGGNGEVRYGEGIFIGYRYYDAKDMPVLFPFGYGLSLHHLCVQPPSGLGGYLQGCGWPDGFGGRDEHRACRRQGNRPGLCARSQVRAGASAQGTQGIRQGRAAAG